MLNLNAEAVEFGTRQRVLRDGNSFDCVVYRKVVTRTEQVNGEPSTMGGLPTLGGAGVISSEDEAEYDYEELGEAKMLFSTPFTKGPMSDRGNAPVPDQDSEAQIYCVKPPTDPAYFKPERFDVVMMMPGGGIGIAFEIVNFHGNINIPPYTTSAILNPRDDLHWLDPWASEPDTAPDPGAPVGPDTPVG